MGLSSAVWRAVVSTPPWPVRNAIAMPFSGLLLSKTWEERIIFLG
jgi:hypothetical protein